MAPFLRKISPLAGLLTLTLLLQACGGEDPPMQTETTGTLDVTVTADGSAKSNVLVQLFAPGAGSATAVVGTNSAGVASFTSVDEGSWEVEVVVPQSFGLDTGETERKDVSVVAGQTATASFRLIDVFVGETVEANGNLQFSPSTLTIGADTQVRWMNVSVELHTVTPDGHSEWSAASLPEEGDVFIHTFDTPGTYEYYCEPHVGQGMTGTVIVN